jgi:hypothetical protein|tara:strand:- start:980 stop:1210 length:231 start_codon:yes stop_codon:yes gene_type:complete
MRNYTNINNLTVVQTGTIDKYTIAIEVSNNKGQVVCKGSYNQGISRAEMTEWKGLQSRDNAYSIELDIEHNRVVIF